MTLNEAAEAVEGKVVSITLDESAYIEIDRAFQKYLPTSGPEKKRFIKKFMGIEIKKAKNNGN